MSDLTSAAEQARDRELASSVRQHRTPGTRPETSGWTAGIEFAGIMMILVGAIHAVQGLAALVNEDFYDVPSERLLVAVDFATWGWIHLVLGVLVVAAGIAVNWGRAWARVVGVVFASVSLLTNLAFVNAQPVWTTIVVALDVVIIYAITAHGGELAG